MHIVFTGIAVLAALLLLIAVPGLLFAVGLVGFLVTAFFPFLLESFCASNPVSWLALPCGFKGYLLSLFLFGVLVVISAVKDA